MSQENVEIALRGYDAFNAFMSGAISSAAYAAMFDPEVVVRWADEQTYPDFPQHLRGVTQMIAFAEQYRDGWADVSAEAIEVVASEGDRVVTLVRQTARGRHSGVPIVIHFFAASTIRGGKTCEIEYYRHRSDALAAVR